MTKEIIAGVMKWGKWGKNLTTSEIEKIIMACYETGIRTFDHADIYGGYTTEKDWGKAWQNLSITRDEIKIISKCGICLPCEAKPQYSIKHYNYSKDHILESVKNTLKNLNTSYLDLLLLHRPSPLMNPIIIAEAIDCLTKEGMIKEVGVSNFTVSQMELLKNYLPVTTNQIEISILHPEPFFNGVIDYCMTNNISVQAWSPLGGGNLFSSSENYAFVVRRQRLMSIAEKYGWNLDEMAYLFLLHHPAGINPVVGSAHFERIKRARELLEITITDVQWFEILEASIGKSVP